jgi:large subunit ribosomal protein L5
MNMTPRLKTKYSEEISAKLVEEFNYSNVMMVPKLEKIVVSQGIGAAVADKKLVDQAIVEMTTITGQKAVPTKSKKDVSNFKLRKGMPIGARVTLRGERMYEFLDRLISASLPRIRDFVVSRHQALMDVVTILSVSRSRSFSLRLILTK